MRRYVCPRYIDLGEDGVCHSPDPEGCAIFRYLPNPLKWRRTIWLSPLLTEQKAAAQDALIAEHTQMKQDYKARFFVNEKVS